MDKELTCTGEVWRSERNGVRTYRALGGGACIRKGVIRYVSVTNLIPNFRCFYYDLLSNQWELGTKRIVQSSTVTFRPCGGYTPLCLGTLV